MNPIYLLALVSCAAIVCAAEAPNKGDISNLCNMKKNAPKMSRISEVRALLDSLKTNTEVQCPARVMEAILALEPVIDLESVCSEKAADVIVDYWDRYVQKKAKGRKYLPKQLREFFLSFGLQVSKTCKRTMIAELKRAAESNGISQKDFDIVTGAARAGKVIELVFGDEPKLEQLALIDLDTTADHSEKVSLPPKDLKFFELRRERCLNKFKPIYDQLILPAVKLMSIDINYQGGADETLFDSFRRDPSYLDWFRAVFVCAPVLKFQVTVLPVYRLDASGKAVWRDQMDEEDIVELKKSTGLGTLEATAQDPISYKVDAKVDDLVVDESDRTLVETVANLERNSRFRFSSLF